MIWNVVVGVKTWISAAASTPPYLAMIGGAAGRDPLGELRHSSIDSAVAESLPRDLALQTRLVAQGSVAGWLSRA
jgi:hypothetical protein